MAELKLGNTTKQISNNLFVNANTRAIDPCYWYMELFDRIPVYQFYMEVHRSDADEKIDIYNVIFNDLISSGEFEPMLYEYNKSKKKEKESSMAFLNDDEDSTVWDDKDIYTSRFYLVSKNEPLMIYYEYDNLNIITHLGTEAIDNVVEKYIKKYNQDNDKVKCYAIVKDPDMYLNDFDIELDGDLDYDMYNEGFEEVHKRIVHSIEKDKNGLYLLYGKPGTGKSTYIRHLIKECGTEDRKFIYVPCKLFDALTDPTSLNFLMRNRGNVFIIEDCENLVTVDDDIRSDGITDLLNMTDGLLSDALNIKIICTFNTDYEKIDEEDRIEALAQFLGLDEEEKEETITNSANKAEKVKKIIVGVFCFIPIFLFLSYCYNSIKFCYYGGIISTFLLAIIFGLYWAHESH